MGMCGGKEGAGVIRFGGGVEFIPVWRRGCLITIYERLPVKNNVTCFERSNDDGYFQKQQSCLDYYHVYSAGMIARLSFLKREMKFSVCNPTCQKWLTTSAN